MSKQPSSDFGSLDIHAIFLVWSKPQGARRSEHIAYHLGIPLHHVYFSRRRGALYAAIKYPVQALQTIRLLIRIRPRLVFIQDPPILAALVVWFCGIFLNIDFVIDTHTQRQLLVDYNFLWIVREFVGKRAVTNIVTNDYLAQMLQEWGATRLVMQNPPLPFADSISTRKLDGDFTVLWSNVGAVDEPRHVVKAAAEALKHITFYVTGDYERTAELRMFKEQSPNNMIFTDYVSDEEYYRYVKSADVVLTLTTWDHTLQNGACEAMWLGRPVITSDWKFLRDYFREGALFFDNTPDSLVEVLEEMQRHHTRYVSEILKLNTYHRERWKEQVTQLIQQIQASG